VKVVKVSMRKILLAGLRKKQSEIKTRGRVCRLAAPMGVAVLCGVAAGPSVLWGMESSVFPLLEQLGATVEEISVLRWACKRPYMPGP